MYDFNKQVKGAPAIELKNVFKSYGVGRSKTEVLKGIDLTVATGSIFGLLGPSGCGKTTLLKCVTGLRRADNGTIRVFGHKPGSKKAMIPGPGVGYMPQELALYNELSIGETLSYFGRLYHMRAGRISIRTYFLLELLNLPDESRLVKNLSGGQQRRVSFAIALVHEPPLLLLDEPTVGVDPLLRQNIWEHLLELSQSGEATVVITTHYVEEARQADKVGFIRTGRILLEGTPEELQTGKGSLEDAFLEICSKDSNEDLHEPKVVENRKEAEGNKELVLSKKADMVKEIIRDEKESMLSGWFSLPSCTCILAMIIKNFVRLRRSLSVVLFQFMVPTLQITIFCLTMGLPPFDLTLAVVNYDHQSGMEFLKLIDNHTVTQALVPDVSTGLDMIRNRSAWGVLKISENFTDDIYKRYLNPSTISLEMLNSSVVHLSLDSTNSEIVATLQQNLLKAYEEYTRNTLKYSGITPELASTSLKIDELVYGKADSDLREFMYPGSLLIIAYFMAITLTTMTFITEKKSGILDRTYVAGATSFDVMCSHIISQFGVMIVQVSLMLVVVVLAFKLPAEGNLTWVIILVFLQGLAGISYGFLISCICDNEDTAISMAMASFYPSSLMCGIFWPIEGMPKYLQFISKLLPQTLPTEAARSVLSRGMTITDTDVWMGFVASIAWILIFTIVSAVVLKIKQ